MRDNRRRQTGNWAIAGVAVALVGGAGLDYMGMPFVLPAVVGGALAFVMSQRVSVPLAAAGAVTVLLAGYAVAIRVYPLVPLELDQKNRMVLTLLGLVLLVTLWRQRTALRFPPARTAILVWMALAPIIAAFAGFIAVVDVSGGMRASWAMQNDAVWNTVTARFMWEDGGLDQSKHPSSSPLTAALLAASFAPGRGSVPSYTLLQHDVMRQAEFWLVMAALSCVFAALITVRSLHAVRMSVRLTASIAVGLIPATWFVFGHSVQFGFYNVTISLVLLLCAWLAWLEARSSPIVAATILSLAAVALLATWAPLAAIPAGLAGIALVSRDAAWWRGLRGLRAALCGVAVLGMPLYAILVTLPDLAREGAALSNDGGIFGIQPIHVGVVVASAVATATVAAIAQHRRHELLGVVTVIAMATVALGYLIRQRIDLPVVWGYYPAKMGWMIATLLIIITAVSLLSWLAAVRSSSWASLGVAVSAGLVTVSLIGQVPPTPGNVSMARSVLTDGGLSQPDEVTTLLYSLSDAQEKNLVIRYNENPGHDLFVNGWLLQQPTDRGDDPLRRYAYILDGSNLEHVCETVSYWGTGVTIHTRSPSLESEITELCPSPVNVRLHP